MQCHKQATAHSRASQFKASYGDFQMGSHLSVRAVLIPRHVAKAEGVFGNLTFPCSQWSAEREDNGTVFASVSSLGGSRQSHLN